MVLAWFCNNWFKLQQSGGLEHAPLVFELFLPAEEIDGSCWDALANQWTF